MGVRKCCIESCSSEDNLTEEPPFTFHKFPQKSPLKSEWVKATRTSSVVDRWMFVCSKHFSKEDFQSVRGSKSYLKSEAVPSIFPWNTSQKKVSKNSNVVTSTVTEDTSLLKKTQRKSTNVISVNPETSETDQNKTAVQNESPTTSNLRSFKAKNKIDHTELSKDDLPSVSKQNKLQSLDISPSKLELKAKVPAVSETSTSSSLRSHKLLAKTDKKEFSKGDKADSKDGIVKQKKTRSSGDLPLETNNIKLKSAKKQKQIKTSSPSPKKKQLFKEQSEIDVSPESELHNETKPELDETIKKNSLLNTSQEDTAVHVTTITEIVQSNSLNNITITDEKSEEKENVSQIFQNSNPTFDTSIGNIASPERTHESSETFLLIDETSNSSCNLEISTQPRDSSDNKILEKGLKSSDSIQQSESHNSSNMNDFKIDVISNALVTKEDNESNIILEPQTKDLDQIDKTNQHVVKENSGDADENLCNFTLSLDDSKDISSESSGTKTSDVSQNAEFTAPNVIQETSISTDNSVLSNIADDSEIQDTNKSTITITNESENACEAQAIDESNIMDDSNLKNDLELDPQGNTIKKPELTKESNIDGFEIKNKFQETGELNITSEDKLVDDSKTDNVQDIDRSQIVDKSRDLNESEIGNESLNIDESKIMDESKISDEMEITESKFIVDSYLDDFRITDESEDTDKSQDDTKDSVRILKTDEPLKSKLCVQTPSICNFGDVSQLSSFDDGLRSRCDLMIKSELNDMSLCDDSLMDSDKYSCDRGSSQSQPLTVGSKVEVTDFGNVSYSAVILEVDYEEMEVLLQYDESSQKQNEWISVYSTRLRSGLSAGETLVNTVKPPDPNLILLPNRKRRLKKEVEPKVYASKNVKKKDRVQSFVVGERCLARWTDNRRFQATITEVLDSGQYIVIFDDGFTKMCSLRSLTKLKKVKGKRRKAPSKNSATLTPGQGAIPTPYRQHKVFEADIPSASPPETPVVFHRHLFDPNLDYLGSKKERREMKRKLNVKDLFSFHKKERAEEKRYKRKKRPIKYEIEESPPPKKKKKRMKKETITEVPSPAIEEKPIPEPAPIVEEKPKPVVEEMTLAPGEWCCKWLNGEPVGVVSELEPLPSNGDTSTPRLNRKSVQVEDLRLPPNWTKHMMRRSVGSSAGKWDVIILSPEGLRFRSKAEIRSYLDDPKIAEGLKEFESYLSEFSVNRKKSRQMGWDITDPTLVGMEGKPSPLPSGCSPLIMSPLMKQTKKYKKPVEIQPKMIKTPKIKISKIKMPGQQSKGQKKERKQQLGSLAVVSTQSAIKPDLIDTPDTNVSVQRIEDGYVYVGSCKVQVIDSLLRCPKEGCLKNFRKDNLLQMHIKHYHRELISLLGTTPKVLDLAYARTVGTPTEEPSTPKLQKQHREHKPKIKRPAADVKFDVLSEYESSQYAGVDETWNDPKTPAKTESNQYSQSNDSPKLRSVLEMDSSPANKHVNQYSLKHDETEKEEKVPHKYQVQFSAFNDTSVSNPHFERAASEKDVLYGIAKTEQNSSQSQSPSAQIVDFEDLENSIKTHTVTKLTKTSKKSRGEKRKLPAILSFKNVPIKKKRSSTGGGSNRNSSNDIWSSQANDPDETRSSFGTPEQQNFTLLPKKDTKPEEINQPSTFITEDGERIKIVHMKREEIINCACGFNEEDGLMIQCELCLCWQHALCHSIETESQVPDKYVCYICLNPKRGRHSQRFLHDQSWLYEGALPSWKGVASATPADAPQRASALKKSFELSGNLYLIAQALHAIKIKMHVAKKKDHPKLYLWSKPWDPPSKPPNVVVEQLGDISAMMSQQLGKENCPLALKVDDIKSVMRIDPPDINHMKNPMSSDDGVDNTVIQGSSEELSKVAEGQLNVQNSTSNLLVNFLASPGGTSIELPISTSELETLAKSVQDCEARVLERAPPAPSAPEPEAAIDPVKCREHLHEHVSKALAAFEVRLDSIEAQIAELESQDPSLEDDESAEFCPRTKQTIQMLLRDLETMEELACIT